MLYPLRLILCESEGEFAGMAVERFFRLAASQRMARVAEIMTMTARAMTIVPAVEPAREKPLMGLAGVGERGWMKQCMGKAAFDLQNCIDHSNHND